jgi:hypothetical protein
VNIFFSEKMNEAGLSNVSSYFVNNSFGNPLAVSVAEPRFDAVSLLFQDDFRESIIYEVAISEALSDCAGNPLGAANTSRFAIPQAPAVNDLVINEVLFNPPTGGVEYVEIYNRSQKIIDLKNVRLSSQDTVLNQLTSVREIAPAGFLIFPGDYLVLSANPDLVRKFYQTTNPQGFIKMSMPQLTNTQGIIVLADANETILDRLVYHEDMHFPLLNNKKGVSLERVDFNRPANDATNWHSASSSSGYGTPAYRNSQFMMAPLGEDPFTLSPDIFSPDNDGHNDVLNIAYNFEQTGHVATIVVYDANGRMIRRLVQNQLLGTTGSFTWNGISDRNEKAPIGCYIVLIEVFDLNGNMKQYKKTAVLGGRL